MSLEEDLKGKTLALISQQMANWVVEIQRNISDHQASLVRSLDELQETVARYDEKINETDIAMAMAEVVAAQPPPPPPVPKGPGFDRLKSSLVAVEKGASLSEVLTYLVNEVSQYTDRAAMFIVKGPSAIGWYARGVEPGDLVKQVNIPLSTDTVFRTVNTSRQAFRGPLHQSPGTLGAVSRLGGAPQAMVAVPLILRDKLAAILYCDTSAKEVDPASADLIEVLVAFAGKIIDVLSLAPKPVAGRTTTAGNTAERAAAIRGGGEEVRERAGVPPVAAAPPPPPPRPAAPPPPPPVPADAEGSSTVMFNASTFAAMRSAAAVPPPPPARPQAPPPPPPPAQIAPEDQKAHDDAKRFARLVVSEIKLYNESKVTEGRRNKDIYERLKEDIERGRQMYSERVAAPVRDSTNYFYDELVRILAGGDQSALGPM
jgi:hypothetical protein